jgi:cytochrome c oxidase assembly protein subunit 15
LRDHREHRVLIRGAMVLVTLLIIQVTLGAFTVWMRKPADIASAHVAVGALTLMTTFILTVRAMRLYGIRSASCKAADGIGGLGVSEKTADAIRGFTEGGVAA